MANVGTLSEQNSIDVYAKNAVNTANLILLAPKIQKELTKIK